MLRYDSFILGTPLDDEKSADASCPESKADTSSITPFTSSISDFTSDTNYYFDSIADRVNKYLAALKVKCLSD